MLGSVAIIRNFNGILRIPLRLSLKANLEAYFYFFELNMFVRLF